MKFIDGIEKWLKQGTAGGAEFAEKRRSPVKATATTSNPSRKAGVTTSTTSRGSAATATAARPPLTAVGEPVGPVVSPTAPVSEKTYIDAIDATAREAFALAVETSRTVSELTEAVRSLAEDVAELVADNKTRGGNCASCRREVDASITALGQVLRREERDNYDHLNGRITSMITKAYWVTGFSAAVGVLVGTLIR